MNQDRLEELTFANSLAIKEILGAVELTNQNVNRLSNDIENTMCSKNHCDDMFDRTSSLESKMKELSPFIVMVRFPKATLLMFIGLYALTIKEIRTPVLVFLGM